MFLNAVNLLLASWYWRNLVQCSINDGIIEKLQKSFSSACFHYFKERGEGILFIDTCLLELQGEYRSSNHKFACMQYACIIYIFQKQIIFKIF